MGKLFKWIVNNAKGTTVFFLVLTILCAILLTGVKMNLDNTYYLPDDIMTKMSLEKLQNEFDIKGTASVALPDIEINEAIKIKRKITSIKQVAKVIWIDDFENVYVPTEHLNEQNVNRYYKNKCALMSVFFNDINDSESTHKAIESIKEVIGERGYIGGQAVISKDTIDIAKEEMPIYSIIAVVLILVILIISTSSWIEPILFLITIGVAVIINLGLNIFKGEVSNTTFMAAGILQLAVSMDYMIFLLNRFHEERSKKIGIKESMVKSLKLAYRSVGASAMTTIAGFFALTFMDFGIGKDLGFVLARGVFISLICVFTLLPSLIIVNEKRVIKSSRKLFNMKLKPKERYKLGRKSNVVIVIIVLLISVITFKANQNISYYYSNEKTLPDKSDSIIARNIINDIYGSENEGMIIIPNNNSIKEIKLVKEIEAKKGIKEVKSLHSVVGGQLPDMMIPLNVKNSMANENYSIVNINFSTNKEDTEAFNLVDDLIKITDKYYEEYYMVGEIFTYKDLADITKRDFSRTSILSVLFIFIIVFIAFKSLGLSLIAVAIIQMAIWMNLSISYFMGTKLSFISYIVIGAIQLGATVDYAILYISRFQENIKEMPTILAVKKAIKDTKKSIITSGCILMIGTLSVYFIATIKNASELCLLIGRGTVISLLSVLFILPSFIMVLEKPFRLNKTLCKKKGTSK